MSEKLPKLLTGKRIVVLRAIDQSLELREMLCELGAHVSICPMIELIPEKLVINQINEALLKGFDTLIFTSSNGVKIFVESLLEKNISIEILNEKKILVIGPKTKEVALQYGMTVDFMPDIYVAESIIEYFPKELHNHRILIATSKKARTIIPDELRKRGAYVKVLSIYKNVIPPLVNITIKDNDFVIFTSSSTADHFFQNEIYKNQNIIAFCIGEITAKTVNKYMKNNIHISKEATSESIVSCISDYIKN